jgi:release factor glutamine methyltransferase
MEAEQLVDRAIKRLRAHAENFDSPREIRDQAVELLQFVLDRDFDWEEDVNGAVARRYDRLIDRRATGEPLPYITGFIDFLDFKLAVKRGGFIPRATTEFLVKTAVAKLRRRDYPVAVDVATGIGPIALGIARGVPRAKVFGTDISPDALAQARANARRLGLKNVSFRRGSMLAALPARLRGELDVVAAHPPYVARADVADLPAELREFEPAESLTDDEDGFSLIKLLVEQASTWLRADGWLLMEVGTYIARPVRGIMSGAGYREVRSLKGEMPYTRVLAGRPPR